VIFKRSSAGLFVHQETVSGSAVAGKALAKELQAIRVKPCLNEDAGGQQK
jgi:hypothetical protein